MKNRPSPRLTLAAGRAVCTHGVATLFACLVLLSCPQLRAQSGSDDESSAAARQDREVVRLSPFEISENANVGYGASETSSGSRIVLKLTELPQTVNVITRALMDDMEADTPLDAMLKIAPGTSNFAGTGGVNVMIRGFRAQNWAIDGATTRYRSVINNYLFDSIEVIKGPSTLLFGPFGSYGGYVNANAKYATKRMKNTIFAAFGSDAHYAGMIDIGGELGSAGNARYRLVLANHNEDRAGIDYDYTKYTVVGPAITYDFSDNTSLKVRLEYIDSNQKEGRSAVDANGKLLTSFSASGPLELTKHFSKSYGVQAILQSIISDEWSARVNFAMQHLKDDPLVTGILTGNAPAQTYNFQANQIITTQMGVYADISLAWKKESFGPDGSMSNDLIIGGEINHWDLENITHNSARYPEFRTAPLTPTNPNWTGYDFNMTYPSNFTRYNIEWLGGGFIQETLGLMHRKLLLSFGMKWNYDGRTSHNQALTPVSPSGVWVGDPSAYAVESTPTYRYGIVFKPHDSVSLYAGHTESYVSGAGSNRKADGSGLDPQQGANDEIGMKIDYPGIWGGVLSGSLSYFQTDVTNIWRGDPSAPGFFVQDGRQENKGWEAQITYGGPKFSIVVGYYKGDGPVTTSTPGSPRSPFAPDETFNAWGKYKLTERLEIGGGYRWQSETNSNQLNGDTTDPFGTFDAFATYVMPAGKGIVKYRLGVTNLTDERAAFRMNRPSDIFLIEGRRVKVSATYSW